MRELFHIYGMLCFVLQKRNEKPLAFKIIGLLNAVDRAIGRSPATRTVSAEGQIIHPTAEYKALENIDRVLRCAVRQLYAVNSRYGILPDIGAVIALGFPEKRMIALRFKHRLKLLSQKCFFCIRHIQEHFQLCQQLVCSLCLRQPTIKGITEINLIQTQDIVEYVRYFKRAVFAVFKNSDVSWENVLKFLVFTHIRSGALHVATYEKVLDLHAYAPLYKNRFVYLISRRSPAESPHPSWPGLLYL